MLAQEVVPRQFSMAWTNPVDMSGSSRMGPRVEPELDNIQLIHRIRAVDYVGLGHKPDFDLPTLKRSRTPQEFVMLFTADFRPVEPANLFLIEHCYTPNKSGKWLRTQEAYADDLAQWWTYLKVNRLAWDEVASEDITAYANVLTNGISAKTARPMAPATIARRIGTVETLYRWAFEQNMIPERLIKERRDLGQIDHDKSMLAHVGGVRRHERSQNRPRQTPGDEHVDPIRPEDLKRILLQLGPSPHENDPNDIRPLRDRLIVETALYTGMRVEEVVGLNVYQILDLRNEVDDAHPWKTIALPITVTKGGRPRKVALHSLLLKALLAYVDGERAEVIDAARERSVFDGRRRLPSSALFLNGKHSNKRDIAGGVSATTAMRNFTNAVQAIGLIRRVVAFELDPQTGVPLLDKRGEPVETMRTLPKHTFHDLRHTFAVQFYKSELARANPAPMKKLQALLGHQSLSTTESIYLRHVTVGEHRLTDEFTFMLKSQIDALP